MPSIAISPIIFTGSPPPWTPAALGAAMSAWYDSTATVVAGAVSQFDDLSGNSRHLLQPTDTKRPLWVASGSGGVIETDGVDDWMAASVVGEDQPVHLFILAKWISGTGNMIDGAALSTDRCSLYGTNAICRMYAPTGGPAMAIPSVDYHVFEMVYSGAASFYAFNGAALTGPFDVGANKPEGLHIGCYGSRSGGFIKCRYATIIKCNAKQNDATRAKIYQWMLARKAALSL